MPDGLIGETPMTSRGCLVASCWLACAFALSPPPNLKAQPARQEQATLTTDQWREDLRFLADELPKRHTNPFFAINRDQFNADVETLSQSIDEFTDYEVTAAFMQLVASVGDSHTGVMPDRSRLHTIPLGFYWFDDGIYVVTTAPDNRELFGRRVTRVGDAPIDDAIERLSAIIAHDNVAFLKNQLPETLRVGEWLCAVGVWSDIQGGTMTFEHDGTETTVTIQTRPSAADQATEWQQTVETTPLYRQKGQLDHWNEWLAAERTLYFKYNRCQNSAAFQRLTNGTMGFIAQNNVRRFVLDLRDNGGGNSQIFQPLLTALAEHKELNQPDRLYVIIGRRTFSSAVLNALEMKEQTRATFVGEPTGGRPNHYGEVKTFILPNSQLTVSYSTKYFQRLADEDPESLVPDIAVPFNFEDWRQGRDPYLEAILAAGK
jgi:hypothetical protein